MKLARFKANDGVHIGRVEQDSIVDLTAAGFGTSMRALLERANCDFSFLRDAGEVSVPLADVELVAPIDDPQKFLALGMNYKKHADKAKAAGVHVATTQTWFNKQVSCIAGPYAEVDLPRVSERLDFEAELGVVIGRKCRHVKAEDALDVVAGYFVANDVSVRDWQMRSPTFTLGKSFDTHGPIGPWITTADDVPDPQALDIKAWVNGEIRQNSNTSDMIYQIVDQIAYISQVFTLMPGDILITGTPDGTGIESDTYLKVGDKVRVEIGNLGHIENTIVAEAGA
ncbi:fumarylacetoacetate hydrolase family protein [Rhizobium sp. L1K21]|uniref:fumarylacetoacetate hydrolase family protein n=1 Tax=Rhizobium sp. L1K21 TaxID=2954933 RepID=UPI0020934240|nr:fumarylacetoacetate hydrolase family protein [Rhizobium sp. L1K21]MCO6188410.1 fumarylacetoacetate hydrolase family protein [Rhizobium sp. L1K21]